MPRKPTHAQCKALAGDPLILAASDEQAIHEEWQRMERVYKAAMKWYELMNGEGWDLMIAHPPCTHLAVSGARWFKDKKGRAGCSYCLCAFAHGRTCTAHCNREPNRHPFHAHQEARPDHSAVAIRARRD